MEENELRQKIYEISNCEFPLDAFLNDVLYNTDPHFNKEIALRDIEKIYDTFNEFRKENEELKERMQVYEKYVSIRGMNNNELWCNSKITEEEKKLLYTQKYIDKRNKHYEEMLKKNIEVKKIY